MRGKNSTALCILKRIKVSELLCGKAAEGKRRKRE